MSDLSMELLKQEFNKWLNLKKAIDRTPNGKISPFGKYMCKQYNIEDKALEEELDHNTALLILMSKNIHYTNDKV
jgi:hypothetical protein